MRMAVRQSGGNARYNIPGVECFCVLLEYQQYSLFEAENNAAKKYNKLTSPLICSRVLLDSDWPFTLSEDVLVSKNLPHITSKWDGKKMLKNNPGSRE